MVSKTPLPSNSFRQDPDFEDWDFIDESDRNLVPPPPKNECAAATSSKYVRSIYARSTVGQVELLAGLDTCAQLSVISFEKAELLGHQIRPCKDTHRLIGINKIIAEPLGLIDLSFHFERGRKMHKETFVVLKDPQPFDVLLSDDFIDRNHLLEVNEHLFPLRRLSKEEKSDLVDKNSKNHAVLMAELEAQKKRAAEEREKERAKGKSGDSSSRFQRSPQAHATRG